MFLALRRLARSGSTVSTISSAASSVLLDPGVPRCAAGRARPPGRRSGRRRSPARRRPRRSRRCGRGWPARRAGSGDRSSAPSRRSRKLSSSRSGALTASAMPWVGSWLKSRPAVPKARSRSATTTSFSNVAGDRPGDVVGDHRRADAALAADEGDGAAERLRRAVDVEVGDGPDDAHQIDRRDQVLADAAVDQPAVELDVVDVADDDDLGAGVADLGQAVELGVEALARQLRSRR